jgi:hypothetical protein
MLGRTRLVALLLFGSGFCALIYQTTWLREFRLIFGASTAATAAVVGVFMAGLGLGGIILGRRSETKAESLPCIWRATGQVKICWQQFGRLSHILSGEENFCSYETTATPPYRIAWRNSHVVTLMRS